MADLEDRIRAYHQAREDERIREAQKRAEYLELQWLEEDEEELRRNEELEKEQRRRERYERREQAKRRDYQERRDQQWLAEQQRREEQEVQEILEMEQMHQELLECLQEQQRAAEEAQRQQEARREHSSRGHSDNESFHRASSSVPATAHATLGLQPGATQDEIKRAYHSLARLFHPDKCPADRSSEREERQERFKQVTAAYKTLMLDQ